MVKNGRERRAWLSCDDNGEIDEEKPEDRRIGKTHDVSMWVSRLIRFVRVNDNGLFLE